MPRENSLSDGDSGRSLTPDWEEEVPKSPVRSAVSRKSHDQPKSPVTSLRGRPISPRATVEPRVTLMSSNRPPLTPKERFRSSVRKVMQLKKSSGMMANQRAGAEPGIDVRRESAYLAYGHIRNNCVIEIADYSSVRSSFGKMTNREFISYLEDPKASEREPWVKVRWINIGGISWDVVRALAIKFDLHPLALEDILHHPNRVRSKADYYPQHLFLRVISHTLSKGEDTTENYIHEIPRSDSPEPMEDKAEYSTLVGRSSDDRHKSSTGVRSRIRRAVHHGHDTVDIESPELTHDPASARFGSFAPSVGAKQDSTTLKLIQELKEGERVDVALNPMCIFLFRDGTVISMHPKNNLDFTSPIRERLRLRHTSLRSTADPSLLVHGLLDLVVDSALSVVDEYQTKIVKLEHDILLRPKMKSVRFLHILSGDLTLHKRTLEPIKTVIYGLRRYDKDRVAAMYDPSERPEGWKPEGYMSHKASIYLADVHDHMEYILGSLDMFAGISENLINYTFNMASYEMNEVMRKLTLVTLICLPLTLLTGYFGMNFDPFPAVNNHSDILFWEIALPVLAVLMPMFLYSDIVKMYHFGQKKIWAKKLDKRMKRA